MYAILACTKQKHARHVHKHTFTYSKKVHVNLHLFKPDYLQPQKLYCTYMTLFLNYFQFIVLIWIIATWLIPPKSSNLKHSEYLKILFLVLP